MDLHVAQATRPLSGTLRVPGDKSVSHRSVLFGAMASGVSRPTGVLDSADVRSSIAAVRALGATVAVIAEHDGVLDLEIAGWGERGPMTPAHPVDCGNSGTTARLLTGILAGWPIDVTLVGDESLSSRPMGRVTTPLAEMGARFESAEGDRLPLRILGGNLQGIDYASPVASAQVKSAVLLAGVRAHGTTSVTEPAPSRDHTERLLPAFGVPVRAEESARRAEVTGPAAMRAFDVDVPGDPSSAAFFVVAAQMVPGSEVVLPDVCLNPTRIGMLRVLERMGADVTLTPGSSIGTEPVGTITARFTSQLTGTVVTAAEIPSLVDEVPLLALVATRASGTTRFEGVGELRVKESDRLRAIVEGLAAFGADVRSGDDWLEVTGSTAIACARVHSLGDHRLAMAWAIAALAAEGATTVEGFEATDVSYPGFLGALRSLGADVPAP
jgi:3-phosphoshikimate 1-carboxyvinyltransferase